MKPQVKKGLIVAGLGIISIALALGYLQYQKLMNYIIKVKGVKIKSVSSKLINFDLLLSYENKSDLKFIISDQDYKVYLNDKFVTKISNPNDISIEAKSVNALPINIAFNPTEVLNLLGKNVASILLAPDTITIKVDIKLKVKIYGIKISVPYVYISTLKEIMTPTKVE